jgi:hypothetical protein
MSASVISLEERKTTYRTPGGEERPTFTGNPDWLYVYMPRLKQGCGWELLSLILHHQRMGTRSTPVAISLTQFERETGRARRTIQKGLSDLVQMGMLYEELENPGRQDSAIRYAILSQEQMGQGPTPQADGRLVVHLLDGLYEVDPTRLITRAGGEETHPLLELRKNEQEGLVSTTSPQCGKNGREGGVTYSRGVRNVVKWGEESKSPPVTQPAPEGVPSIPLNKIDKKDNGESTPPYGGAAPRIIDEWASRIPEPGAHASLFPHAATALEQSLEMLGVEEHDASFPSEHERTAEPPGLGVGAAPAPSVPLGKPSLFPSQALVPAPVPRSSARTGKQAKHRRASSERTHTKPQPEAQAALETRKAALVAAWLAHPATVQESQMSETERRRFYSGIAKLAGSSLTLEELPELLNAQARWSRGTYTPDPHTLEASLGTLRREAATWNKQGNSLQKGTTHVGRHAGSWSGQHGRDDSLVIKC